MKLDLQDIARKAARSGFLPAAYALMLAAMFVLPFFCVDEYSILKNTTSHLGAQGAPYAWVMNAVFALLGTAAIADGWRRLNGFWLNRISLALFGVSLCLTAVFQHAPIVDGVPFSKVEDGLHSTFASIVGYSFTFFAVSAAFIEPTRRRRIVAAGAAVTATLLSLLIFNTPGLAGIWQRTMFMAAFAWLIYFLYPRARAAYGK